MHACCPPPHTHKCTLQQPTSLASRLAIPTQCTGRVCVACGCCAGRPDRQPGNQHPRGPVEWSHSGAAVGRPGALPHLFSCLTCATVASVATGRAAVWQSVHGNVRMGGCVCGRVCVGACVWEGAYGSV
eukprot:356407-Chlamydomonas_euryale.AAC.1